MGWYNPLKISRMIVYLHEKELFQTPNSTCKAIAIPTAIHKINNHSPRATKSTKATKTKAAMRKMRTLILMTGVKGLIQSSRIIRMTLFQG